MPKREKKKKDKKDPNDPENCNTCKIVKARTKSDMSSRSRSKSKRKTRFSQYDGDFTSLLQGKNLMKPEDQLELPDAELEDEMPRLLCTNNPCQPSGLVEFCYHTGAFTPCEPPDNTVTLVHFDGTCIHKESEEAYEQLIEMGFEPEEVEEMLKIEEPRMSATQDMDEPKEPEMGLDEGDEEGEVEDEEDADEGGGGDSKKEGTVEDKEKDEKGDAEKGEDEETETAARPTGRPKKLINQFNFCERAALTYNNPSRSVETQTIQPPMSTYGNTCLPWIIYDEMEEDFQEQEKKKEEEKKGQMFGPKQTTVKRKEDKLKDEDIMNKRMIEKWTIIERMIMQNIFDNILQDYRYWEDPADEFREEGSGTLLPLWKWSYHKTNKTTITDMCFNPEYYDMFAVTFGSFEYLKQPPEGAIGLFSLKNPAFPEYMVMTTVGATCVDIHYEEPYLLVAGFFDGSVHVYNAMLPPTRPQYQSNNVTNKHGGIVWEVKWGINMPDGEKNFYSASGDGKVNLWTLMQSDLACTTVINLIRSTEMIPGPDGTQISIKDAASCLCFHPQVPTQFFVGSEEGYIYQCSTEYSASFINVYAAHTLPIYRIAFNRFQGNIFASCSGDWRIKIWEDGRLDPLFVFDVGAQVGDIQWAPYSSTVFACCTTDGKVHVFDLQVNKYKPLCSQAIVSKRRNKVTRFAFNEKLPFIIVGDDKGCTTSLKLSPNLRVMCKPPKKQLALDQETMQNQKLDRILSLVREASTLPTHDISAESVLLEE